MESVVQFRKARPSDAEALAQASERAFHSDVHCGASGIGGPPGYNSAAWQTRSMRFADYYTILSGERIVGGIIVFRKKTREYELGRIFVDPDVQNQGIGTQAFAFLWETYPPARRWTLGTPAWNRRAGHLTKRSGLSRSGRTGTAVSCSSGGYPQCGRHDTERMQLAASHKDALVPNDLHCRQSQDIGYKLSSPARAGGPYLASGMPSCGYHSMPLINSIAFSPRILRLSSSAIRA
jgi:GNAT superfamily N-acetyltransferase